MIVYSDGSVNTVAVLREMGFVRSDSWRVRAVELAVHAILNGKVEGLGDVEDVAFCAPRTAQKRFAAAGLPAPGYFFRLRRFLVLWRELQARPHGGLHDAAVAAGYADDFAASHSVMRHYGMRPKALAALSDVEVLRGYLAHLERKKAA